MIERFLGAGHRIAWVTGDEVCGGNPKMRAALEEHGIGYVLAGACSAEIRTSAGTFRADALMEKVPSGPGRNSRPDAERKGSGSTTGPSSTSPTPTPPPAAASC